MPTEKVAQWQPYIHSLHLVSQSEVKPECLNLPLVSDFRESHESQALHVSRWAMDHTKKIKVHIK